MDHTTVCLSTKTMTLNLFLTTNETRAANVSSPYFGLRSREKAMITVILEASLEEQSQEKDYTVGVGRKRRRPSDGQRKSNLTRKLRANQDQSTIQDKAQQMGGQDTDCS